MACAQKRVKFGLVVAESFLREDVATEDRDYSFLYQLA